MFALLPGLIERTGNFHQQGSITALYTVLVEGDDFNEPIADHLRALLDGHIILSRDLAQQGYYPAIAILPSVSRLAKHLLSAQEQDIVRGIIALLTVYQNNKELIELGAYKTGQNPHLDKAIASMEPLKEILLHPTPLTITVLFQRLQEILL